MAAQKQARYATAVALTRTANGVKEDLAAAMRAGLPGASPYTLKGQYVRPATKARLEAIVGMKDIKPSRGTSPATLVREHFTGGRRGNKPMEVALRSAGALPSGWMVVPAAGMPLDAYGNPRKAAVVEVLGSLRRGVAVVGRRAVKAYFIARPGDRRTAHLAPGVYRRTNNRAIQPVFLFIPPAAYRKRIDLAHIARRVVDRDFARHFDTAYRQALATAR